MKYWLGLDNRALDHDLNTCVNCGHQQYELPHPLDEGGKYAWSCRKCGCVIEGDKVHPLIKWNVNARYSSKNGIDM